MRLTAPDAMNRRIVGAALLVLAVGALCYLSFQTEEEAYPRASISSETSASAVLQASSAGSTALSPPPAAASRGGALVAVSEFDLRGYPRGLKAHIDEALENRQGVAAFELATLLKKCARAESRMDGLQQGMAAIRDLQVSKQLEASYFELQRFNAQCQSVSGDLELQRQALLRVALEEGVESSAAELFGSTGVADARVVDSLVRDASNGDLSSIATLTSVLKPVAGMPATSIDKGRYVLLLASENAGTRALAAPYLDLARRAGFPDWPLLRSLPEPLERKFRASVAAGTDVVSLAVARLDDGAKREANETLQKLIAKSSRPGG